MKLESTTNQVLISIIAIAYNHSKYCKYTLNSILNQTHKNIQLIVINDYSTDNTTAIIQEWIAEKQPSNCLFINHPKNLGICKGLNQALRFAKGKYINFVACDDILSLQKIETQLSIFQKSPDNIGIVYSNFSVVDSNDKISKSLFLPDNFSPPKNLLENILTKFSVIIHPATCLTKKTIFDTFRFDESMIQEDLQFFIYMLTHTKTAYCKTPLIKYRILNNSISRNKNIKTKLVNQNIAYVENLIKDNRLSSYKKYFEGFVIKSLINLTDFLMSHNLSFRKEILKTATYLEKINNSYPHLSESFNYQIIKIAKYKKLDFIKLAFKNLIIKELSMKHIICLLIPKKLFNLITQ